MIIENDEEHRLALQAIDFVMEFARTEDDGKAIDILSKAIEVYERAHYPIALPTPEQAAAFRAAEGGPICKEKGHVRTLPFGGVVICGRCGTRLESQD